jgi:hypothetical protein
MSAEDGSFRITEILPGRYTVRVRMPGYERVERAIDIVPGDNSIGDLVPEPPPAPPPLPLGVDARIHPDDLRCSIRSTRNHRVGEAVSLAVRLENRGITAIWLPCSVDGSDAGKFPRLTITIEGPEGGFHFGGVVRCGNTNGVSDSDFAELKPGGTLDPFMHGWVPANVRRGRLKKPGWYRATFRYSTNSTEVRKWAMGPMENPAMSPTVTALLREVPPLDLECTTEFEVLE